MGKKFRIDGMWVDRSYKILRRIADGWVGKIDTGGGGGDRPDPPGYIAATPAHLVELRDWDQTSGSPPYPWTDNYVITDSKVDSDGKIQAPDGSWGTPFYARAQGRNNPAIRIDTEKYYKLDQCATYGLGDHICNHNNDNSNTKTGVGGEITNHFARGIRELGTKTIPGRFVRFNSGFYHVMVRNCEAQQTAGIYLSSHASDIRRSNRIVSSPTRTIIVTNNKLENVHGNWGYWEDTVKSGSKRHAIQIHNSSMLRHGRVEWNYIHSRPGWMMEDITSFFDSGAEEGYRFSYRNNYIHGGHPYPLNGVTSSGSHTGSALMIESGARFDTKTENHFSRNIDVMHNICVSTNNAGFNIFAGHGHDIQYNITINCSVYYDLTDEMLTAGYANDTRYAYGANGSTVQNYANESIIKHTKSDGTVVDKNIFGTPYPGSVNDLDGKVRWIRFENNFVAYLRNTTRRDFNKGSYGTDEMFNYISATGPTGNNNKASLVEGPFKDNPILITGTDITKQHELLAKGLFEQRLSDAGYVIGIKPA